MADLTITVDDALLRSARTKAVRQGTSVDAFLRDCLERWVSEDGDQAAAVDELLALAEGHRGALPTPWTRDELHGREDRRRG